MDLEIGDFNRVTEGTGTDEVADEDADQDVSERIRDAVTDWSLRLVDSCAVVLELELKLS
jgi:hypothetical protein